MTVNLIDTPGHPDFIAEVDRVLSVVDGVVLVISAVEGVQPQTLILMRSLQRLAAVQAKRCRLVPHASSTWRLPAHLSRRSGGNSGSTTDRSKDIR